MFASVLVNPSDLSCTLHLHFCKLIYRLPINSQQLELEGILAGWEHGPSYPRAFTSGSKTRQTSKGKSQVSK